MHDHECTGWLDGDDAEGNLMKYMMAPVIDLPGSNGDWLESEARKGQAL